MDIQTSNLASHVAFIATHNGIKVTGIKRRGERGARKTARASGAIDAFVPELAALEPYTGSAYYSIPGSPETAADKVRAAIWNAWKRETTKAAAEAISAFLEELAQTSDEVVLPNGDKAPRFSFKAGCSMCPCSPGFILDGFARMAGTWGDLDFHFELVKEA